MRVRINVVCLLSLALAGCAPAWDRANRGALEDDLTTLFRNHGVSGLELDCAMVGATRTGTCTTEAPPDQVAALVDGLGLWAVDPQEDRAALEAWEAEGGCRTMDAWRSEEPSVYRSAIRADEFRVGGSTFEYLLLYYSNSTAYLCLQASYAYG
jgi:hypothetical protein